MGFLGGRPRQRGEAGLRHTLELEDGRRQRNEAAGPLTGVNEEEVGTALLRNNGGQHGNDDPTSQRLISRHWTAELPTQEANGRFNFSNPDGGKDPTRMCSTRTTSNYPPPRLPELGQVLT